MDLTPLIDSRRGGKRYISMPTEYVQELAPSISISAPVLGDDERLLEELTKAHKDGTVLDLSLGISTQCKNVGYTACFHGIVRTIKQRSHPRWMHDRVELDLRIVGVRPS